MITNRYHAMRNSRLGLRLAETALARRILQSPLSARITRYTLGSIVAAGTSAIVFAILYVMGVGTTACSIVAFIAGAIPNWILTAAGPGGFRAGSPSGAKSWPTWSSRR